MCRLNSDWLETVRDMQSCWGCTIFLAAPAWNFFLLLLLPICHLSHSYMSSGSCTRMSMSIIWKAGNGNAIQTTTPRLWLSNCSLSKLVPLESLDNCAHVAVVFRQIAV